MKLDEIPVRVREEGTFSRGEEEEKNKRKKKQKKNIRRVRESYGGVGGELRGPLVWGVRAFTAV